MSNEEPVVVDGKLVGWNVRTDDEYMTMQTIGGDSIRLLGLSGGTTFIPITERSGPHGRSAPNDTAQK